MTDYTPERLKRWLSLGEAACLWLDLPFSTLSHAVDMDEYGIWLPGNPAFNTAYQTLVEATERREIAAGRDQDGYPLPLHERQILRDDLRSWIEQHYPHRPHSLFGGSPAHKNQQPANHGFEHQVTMQPEQAMYEPHELVGAKELCDVLGISRGTLDNWVKQGLFPPPVQAKPGGVRRWLVTEVADWKKKNKRKSPV